jgi:glycerophosphoryl diester phosphodiesterase
MLPLFDLQGHRGARGLRPENTLPSFEAALDAGVTTIETDLHRTRDGIPVLCHDPLVTDRLYDLVEPDVAPPPSERPAVSALTVRQLRAYRASRNPDSVRFPDQKAEVTPLAHLFAELQGMDPYAVPTLADLFAFAAAYAGELGECAGKTAAQRERVVRVRFDLELKRVPFFPEAIGDAFDGTSSGPLDQRLVEEVRAAGVVKRTAVRSFDHRSVRALRMLEPELTGVVLVADTAPIALEALAREVGARVYAPSFAFLDEGLVRHLRGAGLRVVPWTVNEPEQWERLLAWGVDGMTTDYPDRLAGFLRERGVAH